MGPSYLGAPRCTKNGRSHSIRMVPLAMLDLRSCGFLPLPSLGHWDMQERHVFTSQGQETYPTHLMRIWSASFWRAPQLSATAICCHGFGPQYFSILGRELSPGHEELRILGTRTSSQPLCSRWCRQPPQRDVTASVGRTSRSKMSPQLQGWGFHLSSSIYIYIFIGGIECWRPRCQCPPHCLCLGRSWDITQSPHIHLAWL